MSLTTADCKRLLQSAFPSGSEDLYDWDNAAAHISQHFSAMAGAIKVNCADVIDTLRAELHPSTCTQKLPEWEQALGLANSPVARFGTTAQRRQAVIAWLRQSGDFALDSIRALVQPYLLYADPSQIDIVETSRSATETAHTYSGASFSVGMAGAGNESVTVADDPRVSPAGAILNLNITGTPSDLAFAVEGPYRKVNRARGFLNIASAVTNQSYRLYFREFADTPIKGRWRLYVSTNTTAVTINSWSVFVEGLGNYKDYRGEICNGLGHGQHHFAVIADPGLLGGNFDLEGAYRAARRFKPAHTLGTVVRQTGADLCAIPDTQSAIPNKAIPCS